MLSLAILAQISEVAAPALLAKAGATIGAGIAVIGAEAAGEIRNNMIVAAALVEGVAFLAIIVCILALFV